MIDSQILTYRYRVKNLTGKLNKQANAVNFNDLKECKDGKWRCPTCYYDYLDEKYDNQEEE